MQNPEQKEPLRQLFLGYVPSRRRPEAAALLALDDALAAVVRTTSQPLIGQIRLAWWREQLERLDHTPPPAQPVLRALVDHGVIARTEGKMLAAMADGWEALLNDPLDAAALERFAVARGSGLFAALAAVLGADDPQMSVAGQGWALADLARHVSIDTVADAARRLAEERLDAALGVRWSRPGRPLAALAMLARDDLRGGSGAASAVTRLAALLRLRLTGR